MADEATPWTSFDTLDTQAQGGKKLSWIQFFNYPRNAAKGPIRKWVTDIWGNATAGSNGEAILLAFTENATVAQNAIGGTVRATNNVSALDRNYTDQVTQEECQRILTA